MKSFRNISGNKTGLRVHEGAFPLRDASQTVLRRAATSSSSFDCLHVPLSLFLFSSSHFSCSPPLTFLLTSSPLSLSQNNRPLRQIPQEQQARKRQGRGLRVG